MAKPVQDSLMDASKNNSDFSTPKNLVLIIGAILIVLVIFVFAYKIATEPDAPVATNLKPPNEKSVQLTPPPEDVLNKIFNDQQESGESSINKEKNEDMPTPINGAQFPEVVNGDVVLPNSSTNTNDRQNAANADKAARELLIRESKIIAFESADYGGAVGDKINSLSSAQSNQVTDSESDAALQYNKALQQVASSVGQPTAQTKARNEKQFRAENATLTESHDVSRGYFPPSKFVLMQGKVINAVLRTAINTDLPGEVLATVSMDIYDSIDGNNLLIPKGSILVGVYNSELRIGQDRVNMAFKRLILPNGMSVDLPGNIGMDSSGNSGIQGSVNNHYGNMFMVSTLTAIGAYSVARRSAGSTGTVVNTGSAQGGAEQIFSDMNRALIERNKTMEPTITIPQGVRILVNVAKDIEVPPYKR